MSKLLRPFLSARADSSVDVGRLLPVRRILSRERLHRMLRPSRSSVSRRGFFALHSDGDKALSASCDVIPHDDEIASGSEQSSSIDESEEVFVDALETQEPR